MSMSNINAQIAGEAADWAVRMDAASLSAAEKADLAAWLKQSPLHVEELLLAAATLSGLEHVDVEKAIDIDALLDEASAEVIALEPDRQVSETSMPATQNSAHRTYLIGALSALAAALAVAFIFWSGSLNDTPTEDPFTRYATALGEQRSIQLEDGTLVHINTLSELRVQYTEDERRVELVRGEAMFDVKSDAARPFRVVAGSTLAEAVGTVFNVRLTEETAVVSVVEGKVKVDKTPMLPKPKRTAPAQRIETAHPQDDLIFPEIVLSVGEAASVLPSQDGVAIEEATIEAITSWRERKLIFEGDSLDFIAAEFNRYNLTSLVVMDDDLALERFSGVFEADDPESFVEFLEFAGGVSATQIDNEIRLKPTF